MKLNFFKFFGYLCALYLFYFCGKMIAQGNISMALLIVASAIGWIFMSNKNE